MDLERGISEHCSRPLISLVWVSNINISTFRPSRTCGKTATLWHKALGVGLLRYQLSRVLVTNQKQKSRTGCKGSRVTTQKRYHWLVKAKQVAHTYRPRRMCNFDRRIVASSLNNGLWVKRLSAHQSTCSWHVKYQKRESMWAQGFLGSLRPIKRGGNLL